MDEPLQDLLKRIEAAAGPSVELDARIACALNDWPVPGGEHVHWPMLAQSQGAKPWSQSLDWALALVEEKLPKTWWKLEATGGEPGSGKTFFHANTFDATDNKSFGIARTPALAVLSALLRAMISARQPKGGEG
jgi:hypothetical protein